ncbi:hypothetical protein D3C74_447910 [compost metagenome]
MNGAVLLRQRRHSRKLKRIQRTANITVGHRRDVLKRLFVNEKLHEAEPVLLILQRSFHRYHGMLFRQRLQLK